MNAQSMVGNGNQGRKWNFGHYILLQPLSSLFCSSAYVNKIKNVYSTKEWLTCINKIYPSRRGENGDFKERCAICLDNFDENAVIRDLSCKHSYHKKCIDAWLKIDRRCPKCRTDSLSGSSVNLQFLCFSKTVYIDSNSDLDL